VIETISSPYEIVLKEIREGRVDPYDVDVEYLINLFRKYAKELESAEYLREAGRFLESSAKLIRLQIEEIFPRPPRKKPERKITVEDVKEVLEEQGETEYDLSFLWNYTPNVGRPKGSIDKVERKERKLSWREFWSEARGEVPLHKEVNYHKLAEKVREKIKRSEFRIRTLTDFIAYLFAFFEYEDVPEIEVDKLIKEGANAPLI